MLGRRTVFGVRWEESTARTKNWGVMTYNRTHREYTLCPIVEWKWEHVWHFIRTRGISYCSLYDEGFKRIGCVGCPMSGSKSRKIQFKRWPKIEAMWKRACRGAYEKRVASGAESVSRWSSWEEMWGWWTEDQEESECQGVLDLFS